MNRFRFTIIAMLALFFAVLYCWPANMALPDPKGHPKQFAADTKFGSVRKADSYPGDGSSGSGGGACNPPPGVSCCGVSLPIGPDGAAATGSSLVFEVTSPKDQKGAQVWIRIDKNKKREFSTNPLKLDLTKDQKVLIGLDKEAADAANKFFLPEHRILLVVAPEIKDLKVSVARMAH